VFGIHWKNDVDGGKKREDLLHALLRWWSTGCIRAQRY